MFRTLEGGEIESLVRAKPTGSYARRIWFLYEWLTGRRLDLPDADKGTYVPAVDPERQWAIDGETSPRHRVRNNLPGTPAFCPLVFRTTALEQFVAMDLANRARAVVADVPRDLLARTAAFLLLKDSKSSYAIEGERAPQNRIQRWGRAIGEAGRRPIDLDDQFHAHIEAIIDMPDRIVELLFRFLRQNEGRLSKRAREHEFAQLADAEVLSAEEAYATAFRANDQ